MSFVLYSTRLTLLHVVHRPCGCHWGISKIYAWICLSKYWILVVLTKSVSVRFPIALWTTLHSIPILPCFPMLFTCISSFLFNVNKYTSVLKAPTDSSHRNMLENFQFLQSKQSVKVSFCLHNLSNIYILPPALVSMHLRCNRLR